MRVNTDNSVLSAMTQYANMLWLSLLWVVTSIPIVTYGAATVAMQTVMLRMAGKTDRAGIARQFFEAFRREFKQALLAQLALMAGAALIGLDFYACLTLSVNGMSNPFLWGCSTLLLFLYLYFTTYVFAGQAQFKVTFRQQFSNSLRLSLRHPIITLGLLGVKALVIFSLVTLNVFDLLLLGPILYLGALLYYRVFHPLVLKANQQDGKLTLPEDGQEGGSLGDFIQ